MPAQGNLKGCQAVTKQYRPSGSAEDQEAGAVGAAGAWPVRPAAPAAASGKMLYLSIWHKASYVYIVRIYLMFQAICTYDIVFHVRHSILHDTLNQRAAADTQFRETLQSSNSADEGTARAAPVALPPALTTPAALALFLHSMSTCHRAPW
jgi:hypothetical protein